MMDSPSVSASNVSSMYLFFSFSVSGHVSRTRLASASPCSIKVRLAQEFAQTIGPVYVQTGSHGVEPRSLISPTLSFSREESIEAFLTVGQLAEPSK